MSIQADPGYSLTSERLRRRKVVNVAMEVVATIAALLAVAVLAIVVSSVVRKGIGAINVDFFTQNTVTSSFSFGEPPASGIKNAILGSLVIVLFAVLMALPVGILAAIYLNEFASQRVRAPLQVALDVLNGIPAIVVGIFVFVLLVADGGGQSALKASFALSILMLPLVARSTQEVLALVPNALREGSLALGAAKWRTTLSIVLPQAIGGIITGATLATARVAGETAPLLFTSSLVDNNTHFNPTEPVMSMPYFIFYASEAPDPTLQEQAWATALVLIAFVLIASTTARYFGLRSRRKRTGKR